MGKYIQYPIINYHGKNLTKDIYIYVCECVCVQLNHFAVYQKLTQYYKLTILQLKSTSVYYILYIKHGELELNAAKINCKK